MERSVFDLSTLLQEHQLHEEALAGGRVQWGLRRQKCVWAGSTPKEGRWTSQRHHHAGGRGPPLHVTERDRPRGEQAEQVKDPVTWPAEGKTVPRKLLWTQQQGPQLWDSQCRRLCLQARGNSPVSRRPQRGMGPQGDPMVRMGGTGRQLMVRKLGAPSLALHPCPGLILGGAGVAFPRASPYT